MSARTVHLDIGINGAFLTRRWEEPENWMRLSAELGYPLHSFCADVLDPFFSGDRAYQMEAARTTRAAAARYGVRLFDVYTGVATHRFHGLSHRDERVRARMRQWILDALDLCAAMGIPRLGGHWDAFSVEVLENPRETEAAWRRLIEQFRCLAEAARARGVTALYNEQMYIPSEVPWTLDQAERFLWDANEGRTGVPVRLALDVGHQAGMHYGLSGPDLDYREWLRRFGAFTEVIHLQQTTPDASHHWPFTPPYNERGHIRIEEVLDALRWSHAHAAESPLARALDPVVETGLIAEIIPGSTKTEATLLAELRDTASYLRQFIPPGGLRMEV
ncbi:MAG: TIM barrel protein [Armatimonadetes bacterium]|nr:TIM barrel protein [Armatimonadota bacterium]